MGHDDTIIFEKTYGVLTPELRQMCTDMVERGVTEAAMESTATYWVLRYGMNFASQWNSNW